MAKKSMKTISNKKEVVKEYSKDKGTVTVSSSRKKGTARSLQIDSLEKALKHAKVDLSVWEVERHVINSWETTIGNQKSGTGKAETYTNYQVKVWLKKKPAPVIAATGILEEMKRNSVKIPKLHRAINKNAPQRELEISIMDLHLGLRCYKPGSDHTWTPEDAERMTLEILDRLLVNAENWGKFERIIFPMGNDFLHCDNVYGTTTAGTVQPEADAWANVFERGQRLGLAIIERMKQVAPVKVISVPGNHARHTEMALAAIMNAYYHNDPNVEVDCSTSPYKFHKYGVNLIGFEHGHSIRQQVRLAALMANECRTNGWAEARYCEWHLGDQHRKGSGRPSMFEEQGVSIEFLPGLVPPNEWHRIHSFNWQKRACMGFVWDKVSGPLARLQINIDSKSGEIM